MEFGWCPNLDFAPDLSLHSLGIRHIRSVLESRRSGRSVWLFKLGHYRNSCTILLILRFSTLFVQVGPVRSKRLHSFSRSCKISIVFIFVPMTNAAESCISTGSVPIPQSARPTSGWHDRLAAWIAAGEFSWTVRCTEGRAVDPSAVVQAAGIGLGVTADRPGGGRWQTMPVPGAWRRRSCQRCWRDGA
jgi:hypothetical protein